MIERTESDCRILLYALYNALGDEVFKPEEVVGHVLQDWTYFPDFLRFSAKKAVRNFIEENPDHPEDIIKIWEKVLELDD